MTLTVRPATPSDAATILRFVRELADYEKAILEVEATEESTRAAIFGDGSVTHALICEREGLAIGMAVYFFSYSTWQAKNGLYLEDLYVTPDARGSGAGKALLRAWRRSRWTRVAAASNGACSTGTNPRSVSTRRLARSRRRNGSAIG